MKRILLLGLVALVLVLGIKWLITPGELERYVYPESEPLKPIELSAPPEGLHPLEEAIYRTQVSEELVRNLQPSLGKLAALFESGADSLPTSDLFTKTIQHTGLKPAKISTATRNVDSAKIFKSQRWKIQEVATEVDSSEILSQLLNEFQLSKTKFGVLSGDLLAGDDQFEMLTTFEGHMHRESFDSGGFSSKQRIVWMKEEQQWRIAQWHQLEFKTVASQSRIFSDVTAEVIPDDATLKQVSRSTFMEMMLRAAAGETLPQQDEPTFQFFNDWHSSAVFPSVNVVDFDGDGHDDLFLSGEWTSSTLLRNHGDGTFEDVTQAAGLKMEEPHVNCALFADFDNDGDADAFLGRTTLPSLFYRNENGSYVRDDDACDELTDCRFVSSASAIDVNRDGLLDLYVSTYVSYGSADTSWIEHAIEPDKRQRLVGKVVGRHSFTDRGGPPNRLLINHNGTLREVEIDDALAQWRNSFQAIWIDFDNDGDSDVYVCNDFSPDALLRNDSKQGSNQIEFVDVTTEAFSDTCMAFGMGASVSDYDSDGDLDLYVSNMYSKAGNRVFRQLDSTGVSPELIVAAAGNFLFQRNGSRFKQVAGAKESDQQVAKVGWSFGGQFADFDNDGFQDLYVPSGLFTAPKEIERQDDL